MRYSQLYFAQLCKSIVAIFFIGLNFCALAIASNENEHHFPVPQSKVIRGIQWEGDRALYPPISTGGDTFPMTWASDNEIYASAGDPGWGGAKDGLDFEKFSGDPPNYHIDQINTMPDFRGSGGGGPKPTGLISIHGSLYLAVQNLLGWKTPVHGTNSQHGSDASIFRSDDNGRTWTPDRHSAPMFTGPLFGGPAFINFGKDNFGARDHFVYAVSTDQWDNGSELRLGRVPDDRIQDRSSWQWVGGMKGDAPVWTNELEKSKPILIDDRYIGLPEMVYLSKIKRYLLLTWHQKRDFDPTSGTELIVYESPEPWGPFALVCHEPTWETIVFNPYCPRLPLKWMEADGVTGWLQCSGSWFFTKTPQGGWEGTIYYRSSVRKFKLVLANQK